MKTALPPFGYAFYLFRDGLRLGASAAGALLALAAVGGPPGTTNWVFATGGPISSSPALGYNKMVYVGSGDGNLYGIDAQTGVPKWTFHTGGPITSSPVVESDGAVLAASSDGKLYALDGASGEKRWSFDVLLTGLSSPALGADGKIYAFGSDNSVYALDAATGNKAWSTTPGGLLVGSPNLSEPGYLYAMSSRGRLYKLDPAQGGVSDTVNYATVPSAVMSTPAYWNTFIELLQPPTSYITTRSGAVIAAGGTSNWQAQTGGGVTGSPIHSNDDLLFVGSTDGKIYAFGVWGNGASLWTFVTGGPVSATLALGNDFVLYAPSEDGRLYALDSRTGTNAWSFTTGGPIKSSPVIDASGSVFFGSDDGKLYAVQSGSSGLAASRWPMFQNNPQHTGNPLYSNRVKWKASVSRGAMAIAASDQGLVYTTLPDGLAAFDAVAGQVRWGPVAASGRLVAGTDGILYGQDGSGGTLAIDAATGHTTPASLPHVDLLGLDNSPLLVDDNGTTEFDRHSLNLKWNTPGMKAQAVAADGTIFCVSSNTLFWLDGTSGQSKGSMQLPNNISFAVPGAGNRAYVVTGSVTPPLNNLYSVDIKAGVTNWSLPLIGWIMGQPVEGSDGTIFVTTWNAETINAIDPATGSIKWSFRTLGRFWNSAAVGSDGTVYAASEDRMLYAIDGSTGRAKWTVLSAAKFRQPLLIDSTGTLYAIDDDGSLYAIATDGTGPAASPWPLQFGDAGAALRSPALGAGPSPSSLSIALQSNSVALLTFNVTLGASYQLQSSSNLVDWVNDGTAFAASTNRIGHSISIDSLAARFWRLIAPQ